MTRRNLIQMAIGAAVAPKVACRFTNLAGWSTPMVGFDPAFKTGGDFSVMTYFHMDSKGKMVIDRIERA